MKKILFVLLLTLSGIGCVAEEWRLHPTFDGDIDRIIDTPDYTYLLSYNQKYFPSSVDNARKSLSLFQYDKEGDEIVWLNTLNKLSEQILQTAEYNPDKKYLCVVYNNGNIDLLYDNGDVININGLKLAGSGYSKDVNGISFDSDANRVFLATGFGYIVIDDSKGEVLFTRNFGKTFSGIAGFGNNIVLVDATGLYLGKVADRDFSGFRKIDGFRDIEILRQLSDNTVVLTQIYGWDGEVRALTVHEDGSYDNRLLTKYYIKSIEKNRSGVTVSGFDKIWNIDKELNLLEIDKDSSDKDTKMVSWDLKNYWIPNFRNGFWCKSPNEDGSWIVKKEGMFPNSSNAYKSDNMIYHSGYGMLVRNHGINRIFVSQEIDTPDLISSLKGLTWTPMSVTYRSPSDMFVQWNPKGMAVDPKMQNHIYSGSALHGLMRLDLDNPANSLRIGRDNDNGVGAGDKYVPAHKFFSEFELLSPYSEPVFDAYGNLWTAWFNYDDYKASGESDKGVAELQYWTSDDRIASTDRSNFRPLKKLELKDVRCSTAARLNTFRSSTARNILMYSAGNWGERPVFVDHKGTLDNTSDDERVDIVKITDQDGSEVEYNYQQCVYEDTATGLVWMGHTDGVFTFRPADMMKTAGRVNRIKVARNDGTNLADYLLNGISVTCITSDNSGHKWFGTQGGGVVVTSSDGSEILKTYTHSNSRLPDDIVYGLCFNPDNNSMMISTDKGLAELYLSSASAENGKSDVKSYPNPVRPDYYGYVTITGLADNALVKIVDSAGNLIKELGFAAVGEITWDVTNLNMKRVPTGVYYVMASGGPDGESFSSVSKILVVN